MHSCDGCGVEQSGSHGLWHCPVCPTDRYINMTVILLLFLNFIAISIMIIIIFLLLLKWLLLYYYYYYYYYDYYYYYYYCNYYYCYYYFIVISIVTIFIMIIAHFHHNSPFDMCVNCYPRTDGSPGFIRVLNCLSVE